MFWRMTGLSTASPVDTILDKDNYTLEELLDEDEIIQECKAINSRLINFLREKTQIEQLIRYIVEEAPEDAEKRRTFKFPFIACEIFTCEVDIILKALVEDEGLMDLLFSFLEPEHSHSTLLAGYFSKVVVCLLLRKTVSLMNYTRAHQDIIKKLVDLIGITSIMEVLVRLIGADEHLYTNYVESMQWLEETDVLEMVVDKFSSSDCPEVHANAAETLCAITRYAPPGLAAKISGPSFIGRLFRHALEESRPKSVLVHSLSVCISLLDPKRLSLGTYYSYNRQMNHGSVVTANPETVDGMLESLGNLLKLLDVSLEENVLETTYGKLRPPLGKHRLKIIEFISVLVTVSSEAAEKELIRLGAIYRILELFFEYPYNNFLHHHVEQIILSCLESKKAPLIKHLLHDCNLVGKILEAEKNSTLTGDMNKPTVPAEGRSPPRVGNIGHLTRISNKLVQMGSNSDIQTLLQETSEWSDWYSNVLLKRNTLENVYQWACGRPTALQDRTRDSDDDDYQDRDYDVAALANNLSQAFRYGIYNNDDNEEAHGSLERDDEDVYFDDESAEVVISSLRLGDDQESGSLFTNSNWFAFEDGKTANEGTTGVAASPFTEAADVTDGVVNDKVIGDGSADSGTSEVPSENTVENSSLPSLSKDLTEPATTEIEKPPEWVEWRESSDSLEPTDVNRDSAESSSAAANVDSYNSVAESAEQTDATTGPVTPPTDINELSSVDDTSPALPNAELKVELESHDNDSSASKTDNSPSSTGQPIDGEKSNIGESAESGDSDASSICQPSEGDGTSSGTSSSSSNVDKPAETVVTSVAPELEVEK
ncbi:Serine/threonine-protein phosphatase 6 regulatory subunit 2 [Heracleum sosnowskyi]|uniref:Serine/threonine-protein phosphatase 6 regulatory subunit 2 n=1 Tax=Heracleum sosnowskyi TaxID=360622 RepID=A0AAD8MB87_9APIA|nr:Serine/threonine-protein phosphatase 6 regulatory subunit 2 [Heracleum sosnowskyi]